MAAGGCPRDNCLNESEPILSIADIYTSVQVKSGRASHRARGVSAQTFRADASGLRKQVRWPDIEPQAAVGYHVRAAHAAERSKRAGAPLTPLRCVRGSDSANNSVRRLSARVA